MGIHEEIAQDLRLLKESNERLEAKLDRLLNNQKSSQGRRRGALVTLPEGADRGTKADRLKAAKAFGFQANKGA